MALPPGVTTATLTFGAGITFSGMNLSINATFAASARLVHQASGVPLENFIESVSAIEGAQGSTVLPHTDQAGFVDEAMNAYKNWYYTATLTPVFGTQTLPARRKVFQLLSGQTLVDLDLIPEGIAATPYVAPVATVDSFNGLTGAVKGADYKALARDPDLLWVGAITRDADGAPTSADAVWPDGTAGLYTGTPSTAFPGLIDSYTITYGSPALITYTQPAVTRNAAGDLTNRPAITAA